ncbi:MAG: response regulator transcription factor [Chloroflexi bacterium]|nr:response regulator transcription factor [Chloroflexota bacterium]
MPLRTLLLVEDEETLAKAVAFSLEREGYKVARAADGVRGLELAREIKPDLLILDLMMPKMDGLEVCRVLRRETAMPILMLTAKVGEHIVRVGGKPVALRPKEFDLLAFLMRNGGVVFTRDRLLEQVWGYDYSGDSRTVDVHVRWLREKIEDDPAKPSRLLTVRGVGYKLEA